MPSCGFSRSSLSQLVVNLLWHTIPQKSPLHTSCILAFWKYSWVSRRYWYCVLRETGQMPILFCRFRCIIQFWNSLLSSNKPLLEKVVRADHLLANRSDTWTFQVLHALQEFLASQQFLNAIQSSQSINLKQFNSLNSLCADISLGAGESLTNWHHMRLTIPADLWELPTPFWCTFGDCP